MLARAPWSGDKELPLVLTTRKRRDSVSGKRSEAMQALARLLQNARDAGSWLEPPFQPSSAFDDAKIPLPSVVEHFERWPVQVTFICGDRLF